MCIGPASYLAGPMKGTDDMALVYKINTDLRPGVESIVVQYKTTPDAPQWIDYVDNQNLGAGVIVKFTVSTYQGFTLTSWDAYYADDYDDTINLTLTGVSGESAWTFTMPEAEVWIRCETDFQVQGGYPPEYPAITGNVYFTLTSYPTVDEILAETTRMLGYTFSTSAANAIKQQCETRPTKVIGTFNLGTLNGAFTIRMFLVTPVPTNETYPVGGYNQNQYVMHNQCIIDPQYLSSIIGSSTGVFFQPTISNNEITSLTFGGTYEYDLSDSSRFYAVGATWAHGPNYDYKCVGSFGGSFTSTPVVETKYSVRYILSPDNSGLVTGPSELNNLEGFQFTFRIKANYAYQRMTVFAIGTGSQEDDVAFSYTYNGETRTYTFSVNELPIWTKGVRAVIETIVLGDPGDDGGTNGSDGPVGGSGTYDDSSDPIPLPAIPHISAADSGLVTLFRPSIAQVKALGNYLWSNQDEFWENLQKIFTNPMDYIIGLNIFPVSPATGSSRNIYIGNWITPISMPPVNDQFYEFNCGSITINEHFGSFLDYAPNTTARIMLPFIGDRDLSINEIMNKTLSLQYRIDLLSGNCVAILLIDNNVYYQWTGNCAIPIPVTGSDWSRLYRGIATIGAVTAAGALGGWGYMALAGMLSRTSYQPWDNPNFLQPTDFSRIPEAATTALAPRTGPLGIGPDAFNASSAKIPGSRSPRTLAAIANGSLVGRNIMGSSPRVQHTGDTSGSISIMGVRTPFVVLEYPNVNLPDNYKHFFGYPSNQYRVLGELSGYTECLDVMFESTTATDDESAAIINALKGGVYL